MQDAIRAHDLVKSYPGALTALGGVSFTVESGSVFGLLGPNGAGKSTTVKILTTLTRADAGEAEVAGIDVRREPARVRHVIGVVAQRSGADPEATGRENLDLQARIFGGGRAAGPRVRELLRRFGLADAADRLVRTYSGGMQRRLDIAMGLVHRPAVLFLDEPTTGLDPEIRAAMWAEISSIRRAEGLTILLTTHYLEEADQFAADLAILDQGRIVAGGSPEELKAGLHGDAIDIALADAQAGPRALHALESVRIVREAAVRGHTLRARADDGPAAVPLVLAALDVAGIRAASVRVARPSLDDVYLRHAGRRLDEPSLPQVAVTVP